MTPNETKISYWRRLARWLLRSQRDSRSQLAASPWLAVLLDFWEIVKEGPPDPRACLRDGLIGMIVALAIMKSLGWL